MELKRFFVALVLCLLFAITYQTLLVKNRPPVDPSSSNPEGQESLGGASSSDAGESGGAAGEPAAGSEAQDTGTGDGAVEEAAPRLVGDRTETPEARTDRFIIKFSTRGAVPTSILGVGLTKEAGLDPSVEENLVEIVGEFEEGHAPLAWSMPGSNFDLTTLDWIYEGSSIENAEEVHTFKIEGEGLRFTKRYRLQDGRDDIGVQVVVETLAPNRANTDQTFHMAGAMGIVYEGDPRRNQDQTFAMSGHSGGKAPMTKVGDVAKNGGTISKAYSAQWVAVASKYFAAVLETVEAPCAVEQVIYDTIRDPQYYEFLREEGKLPLDTIEERAKKRIGVRMQFFPRLAVPGQQLEFDFRFFLGLKDKEHLAKEEYAGFKQVLTASLQFACGMEGFIQAIAALLMFILNAIHAVVGNYGFAIILLTLVVKLTLFPLTRHSQVNMAAYQRKMAKHKPELDRIREKHKNNRQKLHEETMKFMKEKDISFFPLGGCLPLLASMPIFFGLFYLLRTAPELRQAPFIGWITDLSRPDQLYAAWPQFSLGCGIHVYGFNLLPILMTIAWFWQQASMPKATDPQQQQTQQMMKFMPIMFGVMLYDFASGLSLYWLTNSVIGIIEQRIIKRSIPQPDPVEKK